MSVIGYSSVRFPATTNELLRQKEEEAKHREKTNECPFISAPEDVQKSIVDFLGGDFKSIISLKKTCTFFAEYLVNLPSNLLEKRCLSIARRLIDGFSLDLKKKMSYLNQNLEGITFLQVAKINMFAAGILYAVYLDYVKNGSKDVLSYISKNIKSFSGDCYNYTRVLNSKDSIELTFDEDGELATVKIMKKVAEKANHFFSAHSTSYCFSYKNSREELELRFSDRSRGIHFDYMPKDLSALSLSFREDGEVVDETNYSIFG